MSALEAVKFPFRNYRKGYSATVDPIADAHSG
jgi:hypothetical protein